MNPVEAQRSTLMRLLRHAESTGFGRAHNFSQMQSVSDFQARVPLRRYEDFWNEFWSGPFPVLKDISWPGTIPFFALTSGTTSGRSKYIPVSKEMVRSNRRAALRVLMSHVLRRPDSRILENKLFFLGGAINLSNEAAGIQSGDLSGISIATSPWWLQRLSYPPPEIAGISDWEERMDAVLDDPRSRNISGIAGQTAWLLAFLEKAMQSSRGDRHTLAERFPLLELVLVGGVNFAPYDRRLAEIIGAGAVSLREIYAASEGFIGSGSGAPGSGVTPLLDNGLFLEFVPLDEIGSARPARHWMATVQPDIDYAIVVSSNAGLWAYQIGDIVRFEEVKTPNILVKGRTEQTLSAFGEHLIEAEITEAVFAAANKIKRRVQEYAVAPIFPHGYSEPGYHLYVVEFDGLNMKNVSVESLLRRLI